jgi:predicted Zn-dependent protease
MAPQQPIGNQIASSLVNAFSDPTMRGYGHYKYDSEGTPAVVTGILSCS